MGLKRKSKVKSKSAGNENSAPIHESSPISSLKAKFEIAPKQQLMVQQKGKNSTVLTFNDNEIVCDNDIPGCPLLLRVSQLVDSNTKLTAPGNIIMSSNYSLPLPSLTSIPDSSQLVTFSIDDFITQTDSLMTDVSVNTSNKIESAQIIQTKVCDQNTNFHPSKTRIFWGYDKKSNSDDFDNCSNSANVNILPIDSQNDVDNSSVENSGSIRIRPPIFEKITRIKRERYLNCSQNEEQEQQLLQSQPQLSLPIVKKYKPKIGDYYVCPRCRGKFVTSECVSEHLELSSCIGESFQSNSSASDDDNGNSNLDDENFDSPTDSMILKCTEENCDKIYNSKQELTRHLWSHRSDSTASFTCSLCPREFASNSSLKRHFSRSHRQRRRFNRLAPYQDFMPISTRLRSRSKVSYDLITSDRDCSLSPLPIMPPSYNAFFETSTPASINGTAASTSKSTLEFTSPSKTSPNNHVQNSSVSSDLSSTLNTAPKGDVLKETSYSCDLCNEKFFLKIFLEDHRRTHVNDYPYSCNICKECFQSESDLNTHLSECKPQSSWSAPLPVPVLQMNSQADCVTQSVNVDPLQQCSNEISTNSQNTVDADSDSDIQVIEIIEKTVNKRKNNTNFDFGFKRSLDLLDEIGKNNCGVKLITNVGPDNFRRTQALALAPSTGFTLKRYTCSNCFCTEFGSLKQLTNHLKKCAFKLINFPRDHDYIDWHYPCFPCKISFSSQSERVTHLVEFHGLKNCIIANLEPVYKTKSQSPSKKSFSKPITKMTAAEYIAKISKETGIGNSKKESGEIISSRKKHQPKKMGLERLRRHNLAQSFKNLKNLIPRLNKSCPRLVSKDTTLREAKCYIELLNSEQINLNNQKTKLMQIKKRHQIRIAELLNTTRLLPNNFVEVAININPVPVIPILINHD